VLTTERIDACLKGSLPEAEKAELRAHLAQGCEACLERLAAIDSTALLVALAGPKSALSPSEADRMFAATGPAPDPLWRRIVHWLFASPGGRASLAFAMLLLVVGPIVILRPTSAPWTGVKGTGTHIDRVDLLAFRRTRDGTVEPFSRAAPLSVGEALLFRYRIHHPAHLYLIDGGGEVLWQARVDPGEAEIAANGQALALRGPFSGELTLVASPTQLSSAQARALNARDRAAIDRDCAGCAFDSLTVGK
jgi:hypothetical protein